MSLFSLEENQELIIDQIDPAAEQQIDQELSTALSEVESRSDAIADASSAIEDLEQYQDIIDSVPEGTELPDSTAQAIEVAVESLRSRLGMHSRPIGLETYSNKRVALEGAIGDTLKKTWEAIVNVILRIIKFIRDFFNGKHYKRIKNFFKRFSKASSYINSEFGVKYLRISNEILVRVKNKSEVGTINEQVEILTTYTQKIEVYKDLGIFPKYRNNVRDVLKLYSDLENLSENNIIPYSEDILAKADKNEPIDTETKEFIKEHNVYSTAIIKIISGLNVLSKTDHHKVKIPVSKKGMVVLAHGLKTRFPKGHLAESIGFERNPIGVNEKAGHVEQQVFDDLYNKVVYTTKENSCYTDGLLGMIGFIIRVKPDAWYSRDVGSQKNERENNTTPELMSKLPRPVSFLADFTELDLDNKNNAEIYEIAKRFHPESKDTFGDGYTEFWSTANIKDIIAVWYKKGSKISYYSDYRIISDGAGGSMAQGTPLGTIDSSLAANFLAKKLSVKVYGTTTGDCVYDVIVDNNILGSI